MNYFCRGLILTKKKIKITKNTEKLSHIQPNSNYMHIKKDESQSFYENKR